MEKKKGARMKGCEERRKEGELTQQNGKERKGRNATERGKNKSKNDEVAGRGEPVNEALSPGRGRRNIGTHCEEQISWH